MTPSDDIPGNPSGLPASGPIPTVLTIAGSDPSGGAGIQADLKTFTAAGVYGAAAITALTAQNTRTVSGVMAVPADFVRQQVEAVLSDIRVDAIKLGMIPNRDVCEAVAPFLKDIPVVCDPVMISTSGCDLIDDPAVAALMEIILPRSHFLTPNLNELQTLCPAHAADIRAAGRNLLARFDKLAGVVLKGGHVNPRSIAVTDILMFREGSGIREIVEIRPRHATRNTHGTGCTFASAFAAFLARGFSPPEAFKKAVDFTNYLIGVSRDAAVGGGNGPLLHHLAPEIRKTIS